jgi:3-oxoadipate CoA-transferase alpha subunit
MIDKLVPDMAAAMAGIADGSTVLIGGFGGVGEPRALIDGLIEQGARDLTIVANTTGRGLEHQGRLIALGRVRRVICTFSRSTSAVAFEPLYKAGKIELELVGQGTLAERIRAGGAGIPAFYTATAAGTLLARDKETRRFGDRDYVLERAIRADVALIEAWRGDRWGNLVYRGSGGNFNPVMATAAALTIAQVQHVAELGELDPERIWTPGIHVHRVLPVPYGDPPG